MISTAANSDGARQAEQWAAAVLDRPEGILAEQQIGE